MGIVVRLLYRQLLRYAQRLDMAPHLKPLLYVHPQFRDSSGGGGGSRKRSSSDNEDLFDSRARRSNFSRTSTATPASNADVDNDDDQASAEPPLPPYLADFCKTFMGGDVFYHPPLRLEKGTATMTVREFVQKCFRETDVRQPPDAVAGSTTLDRGFLALRLLSAVVAMDPSVTRGTRSNRNDASTIPLPLEDHTSSSVEELRSRLTAEGVDCDVITRQARGFRTLHPQVSSNCVCRRLSVAKSMCAACSMMAVVLMMMRSCVCVRQRMSFCFVFVCCFCFTC